MELKEAIKRLVQRMGWDKEDNKMQLPEEFQKLLKMIENTQEVEFSCDDVYHLLDQYSEAVVQGKNAEQLMPLVEHHINICPDCREEFEALLRVLQASPV
jgi:predicted Holliday junction resolvase-like endonuclease